MTLAGLWLRWELRLRWGSLAVLLLLVSVSSGVVMTAVAAAHRTDTALDRLSEDSRPATAYLANYTPGFSWDSVRDFPEVESLTTFAAVGFTVKGVPDADYAVSFAPTDAEGMSSIERPHVIEGRLADPARADETVVTSRFLKSYGFSVGDMLTAGLFDPEQLTGNIADEPEVATGPAMPIRIVGVVRSPWYSDEPGNKGKLFPSPAMFSHHEANFGGRSSAMSALVRLHSGSAALPAFLAKLEKLEGGPEVNVRPFDALFRPEHASTRFDAGCLAAFALVALVASAALVGQAVVRHVAVTADALAVPRALGLTRWQSVGLASAAPLSIAAAGGLLGAALATGASGWFPIGSASPYEPDPGIRVDVPVLGAGIAGAILLTVGTAAATAFLDGSRRRVPSPGRSSAIVTFATRAGLPVSMVVGARYALEPGLPGRPVPVRSALVGAIIGVGGALAALTLSAGAAEAVTNPSRFGQNWQLTQYLGSGGSTGVPAPALLAATVADPAVAGVNDTRIAIARPAGGGSSLTVYSYAPVAGRINITLTAGHRPQSAADIVLAPGSASAMRAHVGDRVELLGDQGRRVFTVTGMGFTPDSIDSGYNLGGWVMSSAFDDLFKGFTYRYNAIALRPDVDINSVLHQLTAETAQVVGDSGLEIGTAESPGSAVHEVQAARDLPTVFAGLIAVLAAASVGHALLVAARRRAYDFAVLRAVGMTGRQVRAVIRTQAGVLMGGGLIFGVPLGIALGRTLWSEIATAVPVEFVAPNPWTYLALSLPAGSLLAVLLAILPGRRAARANLASTLRAE